LGLSTRPTCDTEERVGSVRIGELVVGISDDTVEGALAEEFGVRAVSLGPGGVEGDGHGEYGIHNSRHPGQDKDQY
jgi:hypothetical protein